MKNRTEKIVLDGHEVFLKGKKDSWRIVYPIKTNGKINLKHLLVGGSWMNIVKIGLVVALLLFIAWSYSHDIQAVRAENCLEVMKAVI